MRYETRQSIISVFDHFHQQNIFCHNCVQDCHSELSSTETVIQKWNFWMVKKFLLWELEGRKVEGTPFDPSVFVSFTPYQYPVPPGAVIYQSYIISNLPVSCFWCTMYRAYLYPVPQVGSKSRYCLHYHLSVFNIWFPRAKIENLEQSFNAELFLPFSGKNGNSPSNC